MDPTQPSSLTAPSRELAAQQLLERYTVPNYGRLSLVPDRGRGAWLWDVNGRQYLDFGGGVAVCSLGHCPEVMQKALESQSQRLIHCSNWYQIGEQGELGRFLTETVMETRGKNLFCNSGAEANEALIKLARKYGHTKPAADGQPRTDIITFTNSFHGRTYGGISATGQDKVKHGFEPLVPGFTHLPYNDLAALEAAITPHTIAVLVEPLQGEGGIHVASAEFLRGLVRLREKHDILILFDEVQSGIGRAGHWCGWKPTAPDVVPDGVSWAKGIGGGFPIGAVWIRERPVSASPEHPMLCDLLGPGSHGTTYGGSPLACTVALAVLTEIRDKRLCERSRDLGERIRNEVLEWQHPLIRDVRGLGLMLGFDLNIDALKQSPAWPKDAPVPSIAVVKLLMAEGLLTVAAGPSVVRWLPPLNVTDDEVLMALTILRRVLDRLG